MRSWFDYYDLLVFDHSRMLLNFVINKILTPPSKLPLQSSNLKRFVPLLLFLFLYSKSLLLGIFAGLPNE